MPYLGGPATAPPTGSAPLVYHGGPVMTTNTVYAIYWVPAAPVNSRLPTISGIAMVGRRLRATRGTWSNSPRFAYRWLRCPSTGPPCERIASAASSAYVLVKADAGNRIEVRVTATNMVGRGSATSAPTDPVAP